MSQHLSEFCVTYLFGFIEENQVRVFAGAGIVEGSQPVEEWLEIERKAAGLISRLQRITENKKNVCKRI